MARFDDEFIKRLKEETDIVALIESYGTKLKPRSEASGEMIGLCPIHDDKNPSLVVNRKKNEWCCLGACGKGGDVFSWVMHAEKVSFRHAVELLSNNAVGKAAAGGTKAANVRRLESPIETTAADHELLAQVASYYHARLKQSPDALAYLQKRFITDPEAIERFQIGFSDRTLGLTLPVKQNKSGAEIRQRLQTLGVLKETGHERFRGCVTFPVPVVGGVGEIYGRRIDPKTPENQRHWYLDGRHLGVWNLEAFTACDELILCESVIDALTFWCAGYRNVTTIWGTNGLTSDMLDALKQHEIKRLLIAYDADEAGDNATHAHAERFGSLGIECFRTRVSDGAHDINGCAFLNGGGHADAIRDTLGLLIRNAAWIGSGKPNAAPGQSSMEAAKEKKLDEPDASSLKSAASSKASSLAASIPGVEVAKETQPAASASESEVSRNALAAGSSGVDETPAASALPLTEKQPPVASPVPAAPKEVEAEVKENGIVIEIGNRTYRVRGLEKNLAFDVLKLNVMVRRDEAFYVDTFDLYAAKARAVFIREAARELGFDPEVIKRDLGKVLLKLESLQDKHIEDTLAVKDETIELTDKDKAAALDLLKQPNLIERILTDFDACGVVGEETNKLVGYLAATSRKLDKPLAVVIQSSSAAGKSSLMDAVLKFIPSEEQVGYSAMTGQSLFYMGGMNLQHKILSIAEEEGIAQASYALKLLQSEGQLTIASTGKDPGTGRMETQEYHVEGPVMIFLTTTAIDIDEELLNRCVVLTVDENREQTRAIQTQQRINETLDGMLASKRTTALRKLHQNAQRLLRPLLVVNPFANELRFVDDCARRRRDHMKYLAMIRSIALLHQYQRSIKTATIDDEAIQYVEVIPSDITLANRLSNHVLGNSIDELPPQTRRLLLELFDWVQSECKRLGVEQREFTFSRRMVREALGWNQTQLCIHFQRLAEMDYLLVRRGGRGSTLVYELLYDGRGREGQPTLCGLIDVQKLDAEPTTTAPNLSGSKPKRSEPANRLSASNRGENGPVSDAEKNGKAKETPG